MSPRLCGVSGQFHPTGLPTAAGVNLRLDDDSATQPVRNRLNLCGRTRDFAVGNRDAGFSQDVSRLVLV